MTITAACPNCGTDISGPFCATCGQEHKELRKFFWNLASDAFENVFRLDSRAARTLFYLFFRPGLLSAEYFVGRRARYVPPIRLYLIISFLFFFILPLLVSALLSLAAGSPVEAVTNPLDNALNIWIPIYIFLSMKRVYQQGYFVSLLKFSMLTSLYWFLALMGFISAIIIGVMMF